MNFLSMFKHLLPRGRAWSITIEKTLREFFDGFSSVGKDAREYVDDVYLDLYPATTRELDAWEVQFNLQSGQVLTDEQRRERLDGAWKLTGGQSPSYIQSRLQSLGFNVYVHEWWIPQTEPDVGVDAWATPRNPVSNLTLEYSGSFSNVSCGESNSLCGREKAMCGGSFQVPGYLLVNKTSTPVPNINSLANETYMQAGESYALAGNYFSFKEQLANPEIPIDTKTWPYFAYVGASDFGIRAEIPIARRGEFEDACLKLMPAHLWIGLLVQYV